jgi:hypothetical protein
VAPEVEGIRAAPTGVWGFGEPEPEEEATNGWLVDEARRHLVGTYQEGDATELIEQVGGEPRQPVTRCCADVELEHPLVDHVAPGVAE